jgi:hypothetical protein
VIPAVTVDVEGQKFKQKDEIALEIRLKNLEKIILNLNIRNTPGQIRTAVAGSKVLHD